MNRRSNSPNVFEEIRKMSLASQDALEEKRRTSSATGMTKKLSKRYKRRKRREEEYTDKDRAAAVTLGSRDIKQSLKAKKKRERKLHLSDWLSSEEFLCTMLLIEATFQIKGHQSYLSALNTLSKVFLY